MNENGIRMARFDHVNKKGDLVFVCDHRHFAVRVDDALDHAILEAKQIREEEGGESHPQATSPLPVSSIQAAVRAGSRPTNVAQQFAVNEALVRRFAAPVETEKKYAIEQFLTMPAPKGSSAHTNQDLIARVLRQAGVSMKAITWEATRQGYEPWKISGVVQVGKQILNAQWAWNMHDNTITSLNAAAKALLEQYNPAGTLNPDVPDSPYKGDNLSANTGTPISQTHQNLEQDSASSEPRQVQKEEDSYQRKPNSSLEQENQLADIAAEASTQNNQDRHSALTAWLYGRPEHTGSGTKNPGVDDRTKPTIPHDQRGGKKGQTSQDDQPTTTLPQQEPIQERNSSPKRNPHQPSSPETVQNKQVDNTQEEQGQRRHSGRSAVPSWDEILFGD